MTYGKNLLIAIDQLINWLFMDDMHCAKAYIAEMTGTQNESIYRKE